MSIQDVFIIAAGVTNFALVALTMWLCRLLDRQTAALKDEAAAHHDTIQRWNKALDRNEELLTIIRFKLEDTQPRD